MKLYLNHGNGNVSNPDSNNHQFMGKQIFGLSGYWGSTIEVDNLQNELRIGVDKGEEDQRLYLVPNYSSNINPRGNSFPSIRRITPGKGLNYTATHGCCQPEKFKFDVSLQKKSKVKLTQIKNGVTSELINTDRDFKLEISVLKGDTYNWIIDGDNTILILASFFI